MVTRATTQVDSERPGSTSDFIKSDTEEAVFLANPILDNLLSTVMALSAELWADRRRNLVVQRLAEDTGFKDNYFDIVTSYIMHHEMPAEISKTVFREAHRITRPGGYYYPIDFRSGRQAMRPTAYQTFIYWWDHRWNNERWTLEYGDMAFEDEMEDVEFALNPKAKAALRGFGIREGVKTT